MGQLTGVIQSISSGQVRVLVSDASEEACSACALYGSCMSSRKSEADPSGEKNDLSARIITVYDHPIGLNIGDNVVLEEAPGLQLKGALYAFILPLVLVVSLALTLSNLRVSEAVMAGALLAFLAVYGFVMWLLREKFKKILYYKILSVARGADRIC